MAGCKEMDRIWRLYREREYGRQTPDMRERFFELDWNEAHAEDRQFNTRKEVEHA